jgi:uncharacterized glyoxalase superfamily protein PhnB
MSASNTVASPLIYPTFRYRDAGKMLDWLQRAFGFAVHAKYMDGDILMHAELGLGSSLIMLGTVRDDAYGRMVGAPGDPGGKSTYVVVEDTDAVFARTKAAGAKILEEPVDRDYGSRDFICADPEGNVWNFGTYQPKSGVQG